MAPTTNNKPCAQHTETSGGRPGHINRTVTLLSFYKTKFKDKIAKDGSALVSLKSLVFRTSLND